MVLRALVLLLAIPVFAAPTPYSVAKLVDEKNEAQLIESLREAVASPTPLVRATAARVIAVRALTQLLPLLRETVQSEKDGSAAREQIRALALVGQKDDLDAALKAASKWPAGMDEALALAVARRGGQEAIGAYLSTLRSTRMRNSGEFFRVALWARSDLLPYVGSRIIGAGDERGWRGLLEALRHSDIAMHGPVMASSFDSASEDIRSASIWYLVYGYASDPKTIAEPVQKKIVAPRAELSTNREDFGLEILRRMLGAEKKDDRRWLAFLDTDEADGLFVGEGDALQFLTDGEYALRYKRCEVQERECEIPRVRTKERRIPSQVVEPAAFDLPSVLPAGLADAILRGANCNDAWLGVADATVDSSGRVHKLDLSNVGAIPLCKSALDTLLRVSFSTNTSMRSGFTGSVLLVHEKGGPICIDETLPDESMTATFRVAGPVEVPQVIKRIPPKFSHGVRKKMGGQSQVLVILSAVVSKEGCVRSIRLLSQSPYPELNGAAALALSQWTFRPGRLDGKPVDTQFSLTINFKIP